MLRHVTFPQLEAMSLNSARVTKNEMGDTAPIVASLVSIVGNTRQPALQKKHV